MRLYLFLLFERGGEDARERVEDALSPPNKINPATGMPYGWSEESELDGFDSLLTM